MIYLMTNSGRKLFSKKNKKEFKKRKIVIGDNASLGARAILGAGDIVEKAVFIGNIGNTKSTTAYIEKKKGLIVTTGCFYGTIDEFEKKVKEKYPDLKNDYYAVIAFIKDWAKRQKQRRKRHERRSK